MAGGRFEDRIHDRLAALGVVTSRPMFGGNVSYRRDVIFAICYRERLYLKVGERSRPDFEAVGMGPFRLIVPFGADRHLGTRAMMKVT